MSTESVSRAHGGHSLTNQDQSSPARRQYIRPALLLVDYSPTPRHWDLASRKSDHLDVSEEDGYILSANGEGSTSGVFVPCEPLSAVRRARAGRLRVKPTVLHRRRILLGITTSPISPTAAVSASSSSHLPTNHSSQRSISAQPSSGFLLRDRLPPTPLTPNTDFKNLYDSLRKCDVLPAAKTAATPEVPPVPPTFPISPPVSPAVSAVSSSPRQQRPVLHVQTSSPVGTSAPPSTPALTSPSPSTFQFRPSGRLPKRPPLPVWPAEHYPRAVVV
ncbi:hypothetical protein DFH94DRAFT_723554 [Russula ochroleuca]|jgi:hypothetical protein|uniref:Uncharacterized protein n=1 Tax=Russula ochroleuca TaxID=152965 RepID=A0A9P5N0Z4_9AGAM|nr:hypothetical protein DFH94DRAFT_723554 [Russula ochroleuca]